MTDRKLRILLSQPSQNKPIGRELCQRLLAEEWIHPWLDEEEILLGQDWKIEISNTLDSS